MRVINDYILLEVDQITNDKITAPGGTEFYIDTSWDPQHHVKLDHKVAATPNVAKSFWNNVSPLDDHEIDLNFEVGDIVYTYYSSINEQNLFYTDRQYARVRAAEVFAVEDDSELGFRSCGEWVIMEPGVKDTSIDSNLIITPDDLKQSQDDSWGTVVSVGPNVDPNIKVGQTAILKRQPARANPGVELYDNSELNSFRKGERMEGRSFAFPNYINGKLYYVQLGSSYTYESVTFKRIDGSTKRRGLYSVDRQEDVDYVEVITVID